jgi:hypothetical protein
MKLRNIVFFSLLILLLGCKEEFLIETKGYEPTMVVDGLISNEEGPCTIKVSISTPINVLETVPYGNCIVTLYENDLNSEIMQEVEPGVYQTSYDGIHGVVGNIYRISILTPDNKEYITENQEMKELVEIDSIYADIEYVKVKDYPYDLPGFQFYVNTKMGSSNDAYFLWRLIETYEYTADYHLFATFDGFMHYNPYRDKYFRCWKTQVINEVHTGNTSNLTSPQINKHPLQYVGTDSKKLQVKYSFLLKQYCINKDVFQFWKSVEKMFSGNNFLVTSQPYNIKGNVKNIHDTKEQVFGCFMVASVSAKRVFVDRPQVGFYYEKCIPFTDIDGAVENWRSGTLYFVQGGRGIVSKGCVDCREIGSSIIRPDFWDE